ncbi:hypothetical protein FRB96_007234 [Tulasnella sp. 330]|nr:hypothetical protein FRB96_007234 [Tulasnella sp. 330]
MPSIPSRAPLEVDKLVAVTNVDAIIKGLLDTSKNQDDFEGTLATMNEQGWVELDKRIRAMDKAPKKPRLTRGLGIHLGTPSSFASEKGQGPKLFDFDDLLCMT